MNLELDNITLYSSQVYLSEDNSNPDSYIAKFIICDFGRNKNGVAIDRNGIESWLSTLKNKPLVGKIKMRFDGTYDFTGHNMKIVEKVDEDGNKYKDVEFDTNAFGSFFDIAIETINDKEYIVASCEIWKRFSRACDIIIKRIQEGTLHTSWEIAVEKSHQGIVDGLMTKIIDAGRFIGHCLLAKDVEPAYDSSGLLEIASSNYDVEFAEALSQDIISQGLDIENKVKEENNLPGNIKTNVAEGERVVKNPIANIDKQATENATSEATKTNKTVESSENNTEQVKGTEISALTEDDLRKKIREACRAKLGQWCWISFHFPVEKEVWLEVDERESELDFVRMTYTVENDVITVSEPEYVKLTVSVSEINAKVAEMEKEIETVKAELDIKNDAITKASETIQNLNTQIAELTPYKEKAEIAEREEIEKQIAAEKEALRNKLLKGNLFTESEISEKEIQDLIEARDVSAINSLIADKFVASFDVEGKQNPDISTDTDEGIVSATANLESSEDETDIRSFMRKILFK